jgi:hypothetical protein
MERFPNPLQVELRHGKTWRLLAPFSYRGIEAQLGFETDFASTKPVRRVAIYGLALALLLTLLPWQWLAWSAYGIGLTCLLLYALIAGVGNQAATVHDWLYTTGQLPRRAADRLFRLALIDSGVSPWRAWIMWAGVRLGGHWRYCAKP